MQVLIEHRNDFQNITKETQKSRNNDFKKNNITDKHAENHVINISDRYKVYQTGSPPLLITKAT